MIETPQVSDIGEQAKTAAAFFGALFNPGLSPVLKAQADLLEEAETTVSSWLRRCHDAVVDTQQVVSHLRASKDPLDALKVQQEWMSRAFQRMAADTAAYQTTTQQLTERAKTWFPQAKAFTESVTTVAAVTENGASKAAAATRAAGKPLREANTSA